MAELMEGAVQQAPQCGRQMGGQAGAVTGDGMPGFSIRACNQKTPCMNAMPLSKCFAFEKALTAPIPC
jgi:hypothetical protein